MAASAEALDEAKRRGVMACLANRLVRAGRTSIREAEIIVSCGEVQSAREVRLNKAFDAEPREVSNNSCLYSFSCQLSECPKIGVGGRAA